MKYTVNLKFNAVAHSEFNVTAVGELKNTNIFIYKAIYKNAKYNTA